MYRFYLLKGLQVQLQNLVNKKLNEKIFIYFKGFYATIRSQFGVGEII